MVERSRYGFRIDREKLRALRLVKMGWSQEDLGRVAGISMHQVSRLETGQHTAQLRTAHKLAKALGVPLGSLVIWDQNLQDRVEEDRKAGSRAGTAVYSARQGRGGLPCLFSRAAL
jgi:transcriptional regulator with XRE-family HTH domain